MRRINKIRQNCTIPYIFGYHDDDEQHTKPVNPDQLLVHLRTNYENATKSALERLLQLMQLIGASHVLENRNEKVKEVHEEVSQLTQPYLQDRFKKMSQIRSQQKASTDAISSKYSNYKRSKSNQWWTETLKRNSNNKPLFESIKSISAHSSDMW